MRSTWPARIGAAAQSINGKASGADDCPPAGGELTTAAFVRSSVSPGPDHPHLDREGAKGQRQPDDEQPIGIAEKAIFAAGQDDAILIGVAQYGLDRKSTRLNSSH